MSGFSFSKLKRAKPSMRNRLFLYMGALAVLLLVVLFAALLLLGQLKSPREETKKALTFQMEAFRADMTSLWRNVSIMGIHLSEDMTAIIEEQTENLERLSGNVDALEQLEEAMLEPLCQYVQQTDCSGAFVVLNASLNTASADGSHSGLYVQRSNSENTTSDLLLYRGMADVGRRHKVMPHRKWAQELHLDRFSCFSEHLEKASAPIERACRTTELLTLPGTSEQAILLTVPMIGSDGTLYGLCGFSVNQAYFSAHHAQPSGISDLACVLSDSAKGLSIQSGLLTYPTGGFCFVPDELLTEKSIRGGLTAFSGTDLSFVGLSEPFLAAVGDPVPHTLTVLISQDDYTNALMRSALEIGALLTLLIFFVAVCCLFYARRYLRPIMRDIELLKEENCGGVQTVFDELQPLSARLRSHERTITDLKTEKQDLLGQVEQVEADAKRLAQRRKGEIDPEEYQMFLDAYRRLEPDFRAVIDSMVDGVSAQDLAEQLGKKISTIYSYCRDVYEKVGLHGSDKLQQLRVCVTLMRWEQESQAQ